MATLVGLSVFLLSGCSDEIKHCMPEFKCPGPCERVEDGDDDGNPNFRAKYTYNHEGLKILMELDYQANGVFEDVWEYTYDDAGNLLMSEYDVGMDGIVEQRNTYTYDENNNRLTYEFGGDGPGPSYRYTYTYDENGNLLMAEQDQDADGEIDSRRFYIYDENGCLEKTEIDIDANGFIDGAQYYTSDEHCNILTMEKEYETMTFTYDQNGNILTETLENDDGSETTVYAYDQYENLLMKKTDGYFSTPGGGKIDSRTNYWYDCWCPQ